ncbi:manganese efflux pump [Candidatus Bathyarchaeota archaeon]|nr:MAG: manganese efflux pump [Candidatus Bathyarchaeota archaeon]
MDVITILLIAFGLALDSFSVSITSGLTIKRLKINDALRIAVFFGFFQAIMPVIGWSAGINIINFISGIDHWIAFGLLSFIGSRMIYETIRTESSRRIINPRNINVLLMLSIATSIDALAVGLSLSFLKISIVTPAVVIGIITFLISFLGVFVGKRFGHFFENKIGVIGGLILIGIGTKVLIEHLV